MERTSSGDEKQIAPRREASIQLPNHMGMKPSPVIGDKLKIKSRGQLPIRAVMSLLPNWQNSEMLYIEQMLSAAAERQR